MFSEFSISRGYPNSWMVYKGKSHLEMDDDWGYPYLRKPPPGASEGNLASTTWWAHPATFLSKWGQVLQVRLKLVRDMTWWWKKWKKTWPDLNCPTGSFFSSSCVWVPAPSVTKAVKKIVFTTSWNTYPGANSKCPFHKDISKHKSNNTHLNRWI